MVDSIMDNLTLRTQRRADLKLEISLATSPEQIEQLLTEMKRITNKPVIVNKLIFLNNIVNNAYIVTAEYYTSPIPAEKFNEVKEQVNFEIIRAMAALKIDLAGLNTEIKLTGAIPQ